MAKGSTATKTVAFKAKDPAKLQVSEPKSSDPRLKPEIIVEGGRQVLRLTLNATGNTGPLNARVTANTNLPAPPNIILTVTGEITEDLVIAPRLVWLPNPAREQSPGQKASVRVYSLAGKPFTIKKVSDDSGLVTATFEKKGNEYLVVITPTKTPQAARAMLRILTDRKDQPVLEVQLQGTPGQRPPGIMPMPKVRSQTLQ